MDSQNQTEKRNETVDGALIGNEFDPDAEQTIFEYWIAGRVVIQPPQVRVALDPTKPVQAIQIEFREGLTLDHSPILLTDLHDLQARYKEQVAALPTTPTDSLIQVIIDNFIPLT